MFDHHAHVMWQQNERRLAAAAERRRSNLEAVERSRAEAECDCSPETLVDAAAPPIQPSTQLVTSGSC